DWPDSPQQSRPHRPMGPRPDMALGQVSASPVHGGRHSADVTLASGMELKSDVHAREEAWKTRKTPIIARCLASSPGDAARPSLPKTLGVTNPRIPIMSSRKSRYPSMLRQTV